MTDSIERFRRFLRALSTDEIRRLVDDHRNRHGPLDPEREAVLREVLDERGER